MEWVSGHQGQLRANSTSEHTVPAVYVYGGTQKGGRRGLGQPSAHRVRRGGTGCSYAAWVSAHQWRDGWTKYVHAHGGMLLTLQSGGDSDVLENTLLKAFPSLCGPT